jgi:hypothetical protein
MNTDIDAAMIDLVHLWTFVYVREITVEGPAETVHFVITQTWTGVVHPQRNRHCPFRHREKYRYQITPDYENFTSGTSRYLIRECVKEA